MTRLQFKTANVKTCPYCGGSIIDDSSTCQTCSDMGKKPRSTPTQEGSVKAKSKPVLFRNLFAATMVLMLIYAAPGGIRSYFEEREQLEIQRSMEEKLMLKASAERQRVAALTPEDRASEEQQKRAKMQAITLSYIKEGEAIVKRRREGEAYGRAFLAGKKVQQPSGGLVLKTDWATARAHLNSITKDQSDYPKAQSLLLAMDVEDKKGAESDAAFWEQGAAINRKEFAKNLEKSFIEQRMNTDVTASGDKNTVLKIRWPLASKVTANDLSKTTLMAKANDAGFKKVIFSDGYDFSWSWTLTPKPKNDGTPPEINHR